MEVLVNRQTNTVCFDTTWLTTHINLDSMDPEVDIVLYNTTTKTGRKFFSELAIVDGYLKPEEVIDEVEFDRLTKPLVDLALEMRYAEENPFVCYYTSVTEDQAREGLYIGIPYVDTSYPVPTEAGDNKTMIEPPPMNGYDADPLLQWTGADWYRAPFAFDSDLTTQKEDFKNHLLRLVAERITNQLRIHTAYDIIEFGKTLRPADSKKHGHQTMDAYENAIKATIVSRMEQIALAVSDGDLLVLNYEVPDLF